jgi:hypothetical protein
VAGEKNLINDNNNRLKWSRAVQEITRLTRSDYQSLRELMKGMLRFGDSVK